MGWGGDKVGNPLYLKEISYFDILYQGFSAFSAMRPTYSYLE